MKSTRSQRNIEKTLIMGMIINSLMLTSYYIKKFIFSPIGCFAAVVIATVLSHWALVNTYVYFCAPPTVWGAVQTLLSLGSPMCQCRQERTQGTRTQPAAASLCCAIPNSVDVF